MSVTPKKYLNLMSDDQFFSKISSKCNYISEDLVRQIYYELVRLTSDELRHNGAIRFPALGDFYIKYHKEKMIHNVNNGQMIKLAPHKIVKFIPNSKIRKFFASLS